MSARARKTPAYRLHKPTGQAVVRLNGKDHYLGRHGTKDSVTKYNQLIAEWWSRGCSPALPSQAGATDPTSGVTVNEVILRFLETHVGRYDRAAKGKETELDNIRDAMRPVRKLYGGEPAASFGPRALKAVRKSMIDAGLSRTTINRRVGRIKWVFTWAASEELIPPGVVEGLRTVSGLVKGLDKVKEAPPIKPVDDAAVEAVRPFVSRQVWAMIEIQRLTGMRPGEVVLMRTGDVDRSGPVWVYTPQRHKTEWRGKSRQIHLGPKAQEVLQPWLRADPAAYLFSAREAMEEIRERRRAGRKTRVQPSQAERTRKRRPRRAPAERYTPGSYFKAIAEACKRAFPHPTLSRTPKVPRKGLTPTQRAEIRERMKLTPEQRAELEEWDRRHGWHPNQLRHTAATAVRKEFGIETAKAVLGHAGIKATELYAEEDNARAAEAMRKIG